MRHDFIDMVISFVTFLLMGAFLVLLCALFGGCSTVAPVVPDTTSRTRVEYRDRLTRDTVYVRDSVVVSRQADTVYVNRSRLRYVERVRIDTSYVFHTDTVTVVVTETTETPLSFWDTVRIKIGGVFLWLALALIILGAMWLVKKVA